MAKDRTSIDPGRIAIGTWSGGRFMSYGEPLDDDRYVKLIGPDKTIDTVITADIHGTGEADRLVGRAIAGPRRDRICVVGGIGHDFYTGTRDPEKGFPRFTDPRLRPPSAYQGYLSMATELSLERCGLDYFDLVLLQNPDRIGFTSEKVWEGMAALKENGLTRMIGVAPGPGNGFTLDLIDCLERFGSVIDWAMIILNPLEPWPGELCLAAAAAAGVKVMTRVVEYGGALFDDLPAEGELSANDDRSRFPRGWRAAAMTRVEAMRPIAQRAQLTMIQLACQWNLAHEPVACVVPTLIQEPGPRARRVEDKRRELAALPAKMQLTSDEVQEIRMIGDNTGTMALQGASPVYRGEERPDVWPLSGRLAAVAERWSIQPERDLVSVMAVSHQ